MLAVITDAMERRRTLCFVYEGGIRIVEPHLLGDREGRPHLLAYQIGGYDLCMVPRWLTIDLAHLEDVRMLEAGVFVRRRIPASRMVGWTRVDASLPFEPVRQAGDGVGDGAGGGVGYGVGSGAGDGVGSVGP